jgi:hypothetical protein
VTADDGQDSGQPDLGLIFATNAANLSAVKLFIDRDHECGAFDEAVGVHHQYLTSTDFDCQDVLAPRRNVQVFYGAGGVGKSSLSRALEYRHGGSERRPRRGWPDMERMFARPIEARIDLASESGVDLERILLIIRAAVGRIGHPMHAFDIAFSRYWEHAHPDTSLADFLRGDGALRRVSDAIQLPDQIEQGLAEIAEALGSSSTLVSAASRLARSLIQTTARRRAKKHAVEGCRRLTPLLQAEPDTESLSYYSHLLSWDLDMLSRRLAGQFHVAVFMDTFEDVARGPNRNFERLLQRLIWFMPNVLFVISGRNRLDWAQRKSAGEVEWSGPESWPNLTIGATAEPTQHLVGRLSAADSSKFLSLRLKRGDEPVIPDEIRDQIARESEGYPLYLDMAVARYLTEPRLSDSSVPSADEAIRGSPGWPPRGSSIACGASAGSASCAS